MSELVVATSNPHKVREIAAILAGEGLDDVRLVGLADLGEPIPEPAETGATFEANAAIKALAYARATGRPCLADDSGLEIDALDGRPGVISSHYCTDGREVGMSRDQRDAANNARVLRELEGVPESRRTARFVCVMALAMPASDFRTCGAGMLPASALRSCGAGMLPATALRSRGAGMLPASALRSRGAGMLPAVPPSPLPPADLRSLPPHLSGVSEFTAHTRRLPHWEFPQSLYFVTFKLRQGVLDPTERDMVLDASCYWHGVRAEIHLATVMPDHVHMLLQPARTPTGFWPVADIVRSIKHYTARRINERRGEQGSVWQDEYFDRIVRDAGERDAISAYVWWNPVAAGLVERPEDYPWSRSPWTESMRAGGQNARASKHGEGRNEEDGGQHARPTPEKAQNEEGGQHARPTAEKAQEEDGEQQDRTTREVTILHTTRGTFEGRIGIPPDVPRGGCGFGYDPIFLVAADPHRFGVTSAELDEGEKNRLSHRGIAARDMARHLRAMPPASAP